MPEWLRRMRWLAVFVMMGGAMFYVLSLNFRPLGPMDMVQRAVVETLAPLLLTARKGTQAIENWVHRYVTLRHVQEENEILKKQRALLESELVRYQEAFVENQRLRRLLDFRDRLQVESVAAEVVVQNTTGWSRTIIVNKGLKEGVRTDMPVVSDEGVVGHVLDVSDHYARVLSLTDRDSAVDALVQRNRVRGVLGGLDTETCELRYVRSNQEVRPGDLLVTSGKDGLFPAGLRLGIVKQVRKDPATLFQQIIVVPTVQFGVLQEVLILKTLPKFPALWLEGTSKE
ncbi:rod shape-determining protein MreC [Desulfosoma caldarium]|uniref:Cell shape-determining protein MreC n=1 Tax=Desulfosoma caldarium TaxID=610254 RepID=A0A3N1VL23_9BACT|nr:rod shape-determining protein MreC [Desulfosoma caldarium]ROR03483.1 rod shape-determining protein MreC [Desulfosoma caldarium]